VIVWSNRKKILQDAYTRLKEKGYVCALYDGDTSKEKKEKIKKAFIAGKIDVFLGNTRSGGFGLDYLKKADYAFYVCNDESVETRVQSEDRIHRGGITSHKFIYDIVIAKSVDEKVMKNLRVGIELIKEGHTDKEVFEWAS
jgi:SNF2 family DNA or RNA helicase